MTSFERRQRLLELLRSQPGVRVPELAGLLGVSQGTVRNDLVALAESGQVSRVHGGAVPADDPPSSTSPSFSARARKNEAAKLSIARWAAELVEDGDDLGQPLGREQALVRHLVLVGGTERIQPLATGALFITSLGALCTSSITRAGGD